MKFKKLIPISFVLIMIGSNLLSAQESKNLDESKKMYISEDGKVYFQKSMKVYLWVSPSPDSPAKGHKLETDTDSIDYILLDTEGKNTVRSPWLINPETGKYFDPRKEVIFDLYADGIAPTTKISFNNTPKYYSNSALYYGKGLKVDLSATDAVSGIESTYISINNSTNYKKYENQINIDNEKENAVNYYSVDNVGNIEKNKSKKFIVDLTPPTSKFELDGKIENNILSPGAQIILKSEDNLSGIKNIKYKIGNGDYEIYKSPIKLASIPDGDIEIFFYATDNVNNAEEEKSTSSGNGDSGSGSGSVSVSLTKLYVDKIAPEVTLNFIGDQHKGNYLFVSERTEVELSASDNKSGVEKITYGVNVKSRTYEYKQPFKLLPNSGVQYANYSAVDKVNNWAKAKSKTVYLDKTAPLSNVKFSGPKFSNRDTLFITNNTKIKFYSHENESGLNTLNYSINTEAELTYSESITIDKDGYHIIKYYGTDNVNNKEEIKITEFVIDNLPPQIKHSFSVEPLGKVDIEEITYLTLPSNTIIFLGATDAVSGVKDIKYSINKGEWKSKNIIQYFKPGKYAINIVATDFLGNRSEEEVYVQILK
ncbi:MAG: hypothetical protein KOO66_12550 [Bacteroidales bacterium]|nr:hypothetical protein [Bacteroidales bacterium]